MNEQALRQLLSNADAAAGAVPAISDDLVSSVRLRLRRRRQSHAAGASVVLCALLAVVLLVRVNPRPQVVVNDPSKARRELSLIQIQADSQAVTVKRLMEYQHSLDVRERAARKSDRGQPLDRIQQQRENAARLLTHDGEYRRVIQLFPETNWAAIARRRLQT